MFGKPTDETLVHKAKAGRADAWDKLIKRYEKRIYNYALRMAPTPEDALDLMQEIFLSVYRNLGKFREESSFSTWIFTIASRRAADHYRKLKPVDYLNENDETLEEEQALADPHQHLLKHEKNSAVSNMLAELSPEQRIVVELKFFQDMTFEEMAEILNTSPNTLKTRLYSALKKLKAFPEVSYALS